MPGAAAAVRNRKGLVRVEMHEIETHIAWAGVAHDGVGVGAVVVHQAAGFMNRRGDCGDVVFEEPERVRIGHHADGGIGPEDRADIFDADASALAARQRNHVEAAHRGGGRIGAVSGIGHDHFIALRFATLFEVFLGDEQCAELGVRTGRRIERERRHAEERAQRAFQLVHHLQRALRELVGRKGVQPSELGPRRDCIVDARIVLHRARAQRIEAEVDAESALRKARVMAHDVELAVIRQRKIIAQHGRREKAFERFAFLEVAVRTPLLAELEDQGLGRLRCGRGH